MLESNTFAAAPRVRILAWEKHDTSLLQSSICTFFWGGGLYELVTSWNISLFTQKPWQVDIYLTRCHKPGLKVKVESLTFYKTIQ